jgi:hypothetical protein
MTEAKDNSVQRLALAIGGALLLLSVLCNLAFAWRHVSLQRQIVVSASNLQKATVAQQQINQTVNVIAQDLVNKAPQYPWLVPILQKYGIAPRPGPGAQPAASSANSATSATKKSP